MFWNQFNFVLQAKSAKDTSQKCSVELVPTCSNCYLESGCVNVFAYDMSNLKWKMILTLHNLYLG